MPVEAKNSSDSSSKGNNTPKSNKRQANEYSLPFIIYNYQEQLKTKSVSKIRLAASKVCVTDKLVKNIILKSESKQEFYIPTTTNNDSNTEAELDDVDYTITQTLLYKSKLEREIKIQMLKRAEMQKAIKALKNVKISK